MELSKPVMTITADEWNAKQRRGQATVIHDRPYIVITHESSHDPVYQPVTILEAAPPP